MQPGAQPNQPVQVSAEWWMAYAPSGHPYYHNTVTKETTWTEPPGVGAAKAFDQQAMASYMANVDGGGAPAGGQANSTPAPAGGAGGAPEPTPHHGSGGGCSSGGTDPPPQQGNSVPNNNHSEPAEQPEVEVKGSGHIPSAWSSFDQVQLPQNLVQPMLQAGFQRPTPIQSHAWPILATGRDVIGIAKTGSGKTLSFLLPGFSRMLQERIPGSPIMLVMAPTRELAVQIDADAKKFAAPAGIVTALAYGGAPKGPQLADIRKRPHLLTGTPGRLNDFLEGRMINLSDTRFLVLDEADRMLDMGFEPQIRKVIATIPTKRQTLMFTATWPKEVRRMAQDFFQSPIEIRIGNVDELQANADIEQQVIICSNPREKEHRLIDTLRRGQGQAIVFTATKRMCDQLARTLGRDIRCEAIHGDRDQASRDRALNAFKSGEAKVLVATDVAARGLDVKAIKLVVNFDPANNAEDYVHRIGRTGRAGQKGQAITLLTREEGRAAQAIAGVMQRTGKAIPPELEQLAGTVKPRDEDGGRDRGRRGRRGRGDGGRSRSRSRSNRRSRSRDRGGSSGPHMGAPHPGMHPGGPPMHGMPPHGYPGMMPGGYPGMMPGGYPGMMPGGYPPMDPNMGAQYPPPGPGFMPGGMPPNQFVPF